MLSFVLRRFIAALPILFAFTLGLFIVIAAAPPPQGLSEEEQARRFLDLPLLFNADPKDRPRVVADAVDSLRTLEGDARDRVVKRLVRIGAAGVPDLVPVLAKLDRDARARISRDLAPIAFRMGLEDVADLDEPTRAERYWANVLEMRGLDLKPAAVRRALKRHLEEPREPLYVRQLADADTAAIAPLLDAYAEATTADDRDEIAMLAITAVARTGADVTDLPSLRAWWTIHRTDYIELDPVERVSAHVTETRFGHWIISAFTRQFWRSWRDGRPVVDLLEEGAPATLLRTLLALLFGYAIALPAGSFAAIRRNRPFDRLVTSLSILFYAPPAFVLVLFARAIFPSLASIALVIALALACAAPVARHARAAFLDVLSREHVRAARAKGVSGFGLWTRHVVPNALGSIVAFAAIQAPLTFTSTLVAEEILGLRGLGHATVESIRAHDIPYLLAFALLVAVGVMFLLTLSDLAAASVDPRVRASLSTPSEDVS